MKNILILIGLLGLCTTGLRAQVQSSNTTGPFSFSIAPGSLAWSMLDLGLERQMNNHISLLGQANIGLRKIQLWESLEGNYTAYGGRLEFRRYFSDNAAINHSSLSGPYFSGWVKGSKAKVTATLQEKDYTLVESKSLTPGISMGWKFPLSRKWTNLTLDISIGGGYRFGEVNGQYAEHSRSVLFKDNGLVPTVGFRVAYAPGAGKKVRKNGPDDGPTPGLSKDIVKAIKYHDRYTREIRKGIEKALHEKRFFYGKADGLFDAFTIKAIKQFQEKNGLGTDGKVGPETMKKLMW